MTITDHVTRFVALKQKLGYRFITNAKVLRSFARFAAEDGFIHSGTVPGVGIGSVITAMSRKTAAHCSCIRTLDARRGRSARGAAP